VVRGGLQAVSEEKALQELHQTLNELKTPALVCAKNAFVGRPSTEIGELVLPITCPLIITLENTLN
jgi:arsenate reductase-like glutaredoxin family protein